jgi:hypothetical protein
MRSAVAYVNAPTITTRSPTSPTASGMMLGTFFSTWGFVVVVASVVIRPSL